MTRQDLVRESILLLGRSDLIIDQVVELGDVSHLLPHVLQSGHLPILVVLLDQSILEAVKLRRVTHLEHVDVRHCGFSVTDLRL